MALENLRLNFDGPSVWCMYVRPFHYSEDHGGVKPKELSIFVDPKFKILDFYNQIEVVQSLPCLAW